MTDGGAVLPGQRERRRETMFGEMIGTISDFMYSYLLIIMLLAVGLYFTIRTRGV